IDDAAATARDGLRTAPDSTALLHLLSRVEAARGHLEEAEAAILTALERSPQQVDLLVHYADLLMRGGVLDKARRVLDAPPESEPDSLLVLQTRVALAYLRGRDREAGRLRAQLIAARS